MSAVRTRRTRRNAGPRAPFFGSGGEQRGQVELPVEVFAEEPNAAVMHQAHLRQLANARQGTASTKTRGDVSGGGAKPYRQKGTGRARHGSEREPQMPGGGTVFGPHPRSYRQEMPRKMRRLALRSGLSVKAAEGKVCVIDAFALEEPRTREIVELLRSVGTEDSALVVLASTNVVVAKSVSNLPWAKAILVNNLNLHDLFTYDRIVIARDALELLRDTFGGVAPDEDVAEGGPAAPPARTPKATKAVEAVAPERVKRPRRTKAQADESEEEKA